MFIKVKFSFLRNCFLYRAWLAKRLVYLDMETVITLHKFNLILKNIHNKTRKEYKQDIKL